MKNVQISINEDLLQKAKEYCDSRGHTFSGLVRVLLKNRLGD
ncbi:MAG: hypothetical protein ABID38_04760 [Candidatus Diapherotrites archaeon]